MHDEQTELKADTDLLKIPKVQLSFYMHESSIASDIAIGLCLFLDQESPLFYQQNTARDVNHPKQIGNRVTVAWINFRVKYSVRCNCSRRQWANDPFPFDSFLSPVRRLCRLWCLLMHESKLPWIICGIQWYMGGVSHASVHFLLNVVATAVRVASALPLLYPAYRPRKRRNMSLWVVTLNATGSAE